MNRLLPLAEAFGLLAVTLFAAVRWQLPELWFLIPFALLTITRRSYAAYGLQRGDLGPLRLHAVLLLGLYLPYAIGHWAVAHHLWGQTFTPRAPDRLWASVLHQFLVVGLCEEFFFRGYLQTRLNEVLGRPYRLFGARWGWGLIAAALVFGLCHLVTGDVTRLRVAFFGLLAGWLRERTGSVLMPALYHGGGNLLLQFMLRSLD